MYSGEVRGEVGTSYLPTVYSQHKYSCLLSVFKLNLKMAIVKGRNM